MAPNSSYAFMVIKSTKLFESPRVSDNVKKQSFSGGPEGNERKKERNDRRE
jgi:hypothetical protein